MKTIYIDMDDTLCQFKREFAKAKLNSCIEYPQSQKGFFWGLPPIDDAIEVVDKLRTHPDFNVYIATAPSVRNVHSYTEKRQWVELHFDLEFCHKLIISPDKSLLIGDYLIDDYKYGKGQDEFRGELIHFGSELYPDWQAVEAFFFGANKA